MLCMCYKALITILYVDCVLQGSYVISKVRVVDQLRDLLLKHGPDSEEVMSFFHLHRDQACATSLLLACSQEQVQQRVCILHFYWAIFVWEIIEYLLNLDVIFTCSYFEFYPNYNIEAKFLSVPRSEELLDINLHCKYKSKMQTSR